MEGVIMSTQLVLSKPSIDLKDEYLSFYLEWKESGEKMVPWVIAEEPSNFEEMLHFLSERENNPEGGVPDSTFWLTDSKGKVLGAVNIRHQLNDRLVNRGGHIGYGIRPMERQKGYATKILALALEKAKEIGIEKVLVTCDQTNIGSSKTILNNGGVEDTDFIEENGNVVKRYWIENH
jgi:predicted acetyltransferase